MSSSFDLNGALAEQATALALERQLGLKDNQGRLQHCPLTLLPWPIPERQWQQALQVAQAIGRRLVVLADDDSALGQALAPILSGQSLPARLWRLLQSIPETQRRARPVNMMRIDLLMNGSGHWKLVEANTIAAGMGPFSEGLIDLQQALWPDLQRAGWVSDVPCWQPNHATTALSDALLDAARDVAGPLQPVTIVFLVEPEEDNLFDQRKLARALEQRGARVVRLTLAQLAERREPVSGHVLQLKGVGQVHAVYFRTGYNLKDYQDTQGATEPFLRLRAELETLDVALAPSISLQLASAKAVQVHWYQNPQVDAAADALDTPQFFLPSTDPVDMEWPHWILKSLGEGGGNVVAGTDIPDRLKGLSAIERGDWILMRRIDTAPRTELVPIIQRGQIRMARHLVSELGIFLSGSELNPGGYLVRSKPAEALESGVHRGAGAIDVLARL